MWRPGPRAGTLLVVSIPLCDDGVRVHTPDHTQHTAGQHTHSPVCVCVYVAVGGSREQASELTMFCRPPPTSRLTAGWGFEQFIMKQCRRLAAFEEASGSGWGSQLAEAWLGWSAR